MYNKNTNKTNFSEICRVLREKEYNIAQFFNDLFKVGLIFFPNMICKEVDLITNIANGVSLLEAKKTLQKAIKNINDAFSKNIEYKDFSTRYDHAQIAQISIVYSAYFDSIIQYLPDENKIINLTKDEKKYLSQKSIDMYIQFISEKTNNELEQNIKYILEYDLSMPNPIQTLEQYLDELEKFYEILNNEFLIFFEKLFAWEDLEEHKRDAFFSVIRNIPSKSLENYKKQYYQLAVEFNDFFVWSNIKEHEDIRKTIDVGFQSIKEQLRRYNENNINNKAYKTLDLYMNKYQAHINRAIVNSEDMNYSSSDGIIFPATNEIFVPQSFKAVTYNEEYNLEKKGFWKNYEDREDIGKFISDTLRHSVLGDLPLVILGHPGAGKTLLCHMLAAKILSHEYHIIIIHLRGIIADKTIEQQINQQIEDDFANHCTWSDIAESKLDKPILLIFDGYDELLQASGKVYSNYLQRIAEFQKQQSETYKIFVKCIITSRTMLIDKAFIPKQTPIILLSDFEESRIATWCKIWNEKNIDYFAKTQIEPFELNNKSKIYNLAKQPLLLLMLALYDTNKNALKRNKHLNRTQLYNSLIKEFITREAKKDKNFESKLKSEQYKIIDEEMRKISIVALGMYNRKVLYIRSDELENDLRYVYNEDNYVKEGIDEGLSNADKLLGRFFFIHKSDSKEVINKTRVNKYAYEFLHNTFGEFLMANYVVSEMYKVLNYINALFSCDMQRQWDLTKAKDWVICLAYAPLFSRPVVVKMINEWSINCIKSESMNEEQIYKKFDFLINLEIERIINGEGILLLNKILEENGNPYKHQELLKHVAIYSINIIMLRTIFCANNKKITMSKEVWEKLSYIWKYAFSDDEILDYSNVFNVEKDATICLISYTGQERKNDISVSQLKRLDIIESVVGNDKMDGIISSLIGDRHPADVIDKLLENNLNIKARYLWNYILNIVLSKKVTESDIIYWLQELSTGYKVEHDIQYMFAHYLLLNYLAKEEKIRNSRKNDFFISRMFFEGFDELRLFEEFYYNEGELIYLTIDLIIDLLEYIKFNVADIDNVFFVVRRLMRSRNYKDIYSVAGLYSKILQHLVLEKNINIRKDNISNIVYIGNFWEDVIREVKYNKKMPNKIITYYLDIAYNLLLLNEYQISRRIFEISLRLMSPNYMNNKRKISTKEKAMIIRYIILRKEKDFIDEDEVKWILNNIIQNIYFIDFYDEYPEVLEDACYLLQFDMFIKPDKLAEDLLLLLERKGNKVSVKLCQYIHCFGKKYGYNKLIYIVEDLLRI
ncbi:MAG: AAA family ATPase [Lachnospiraceae bacterium]|nr:AAA family ATPase [Lachnospiraceae bacterium]